MLHVLYFFDFFDFVVEFQILFFSCDSLLGDRKNQRDDKNWERIQIVTDLRRFGNDTPYNLC
jgi:hypothetical protein